MATSFQISTPESFSFTNPELWPKWIRRFERYRLASGLSNKSAEVQVNALIYHMGDLADDILTSFGLSDDDKKKYDVVKAKFERHFIKRRNKIYERAKFNQRRQLPGESVDDFITSLYGLVEYCEYGELREEMIRDRIVVGLQDASLSVKLQLDPELTLQNAITKVQQYETVKKQQATVRGETTSVDGLSKRPYKERKPFVPNSCAPQNDTCTRCGKSPSHPRQFCPAKDATCHKCKKKGHYQALCKSRKKVDMVVSDTHEEEEPVDNFLGTVHSSEGKAWTVSLYLNNTKLEFKIDTGAEVTVIPESVATPYQSLLQTTSRRLQGPGKTQLEVCGQFTGTLKKDTQVVEEEIYVVKDLHMPLLGLPAITSLNLVTKICGIQLDKDTVVSKFPELFTGLGKLQGEYDIKLSDNAVPFALTTPRRIPLPLMTPVKEQLEKMEKADIISRVEGPTDWCAGIVVVPKPNNQVRICVDLTQLNKSVKRERHILPSVDHTLAQLSH